ncbi:MAG: YigZ family protein [candidate division Zixibacteria bacterium]|nr:YigZ family protein [candidate division Zixibacteria bacterium]NIR62628.1 YigZ family protein [candidate division Zixibacteria bacterium]NIS15455.1 YigZ family protein [candidate division Zixibacteria bacterium]NIS46274.1 YigZ family protein [candidate division Zixibacteria bacterium]NIT51966.1 YigZ family protein [candidate division Zixibacteria bacterium]
MKDSFKTIKESARAEIKIQRSKFIASAFPCQSQDEAESEIEKISDEFHDASHNCYGYRIYPSEGLDIFRYSDAGEPSGTAGRPIYDSIVSAGLFNTGIVVTRYFGGIKLGTGGLKRAYRDAARSVLESVKIVEVLLTQEYKVKFPLNLTNIILRTLSSEGIKVLDSIYTDEGEIIFEVRLSLTEKVEQELMSATNARIELEKI